VNPGHSPSNKWVQLLADRALRMSSPFVRPNSDAVCVFGCPKSGTSAVSALLAKAGGLSVTVDIPPLWRTPVWEVHAGQRSAASLIRHHRAYFSRDLIKEPALTTIMDDLLPALGAQKVVFVIREPKSTVRSILQRRGLPGNAEQLSPKQWSQVYKGSWHWTYDWPYRYSPQVPPWLKDRTYVEGLATLWQWGVDALERTQALGWDPLVVRYEDFLDDKLETIHSTLASLDIPVKMDVSPFLDRQFQPKGNHSVSLPDFFGLDNLSRIESITKTGRHRFNYY